MSLSEQGGADGKNRGKRESDWRVPRVIRRAEGGGRRCARHVTATRTRQSRRWHSRTHVEAGGSMAGGESCLLALFKQITELPLAQFLKLLSNLYGNSKISKNKSCSKFKVLQLCFNNHTQILSRFENASLKSKGDTLRIYPLSNYFKFYITTLKTLKTNFVHLDKLYTFPYKLNPKMCLHFELGFLG